jgi:hypothetical protein
MVDHYGTPYSEALHVVERYRLVDCEVAKEGAVGRPLRSFQENCAEREAHHTRLGRSKVW